jgi:membrane-associated protease RseP (regulator of RpoE activity)
MTQLSHFLSVWRTVVVRDREIIDATVRPEHRGPSSELTAALRNWSGTHYWSPEDGEGRLVLIRSLAAQKERWWFHLALFLLSFFTVWMGGALLSGADVAVTLPLMGREALAGWIGQLKAGTGLDFAVALMGILLAHEMGHYVLARRYTINASPPFFLPAPPWLNFIGTFGAFIRLRSPVVDRRQLLDVGAAGPWAGFAVALAALLVGLSQSEVMTEVGPSPLAVMFGDATVYLGDSLITRWARGWLVGEGTVALSPLAQAGWFGVLVTMLNLMPLGQLDGGHVLYALVRDRQRFIGMAAWVSLLILGREFWGWWFWAGFTLLLGGGRIAHPTVLDRHRPLPASRHLLGWATVVLLVVTFTPRPFVW